MQAGSETNNKKCKRYYLVDGNKVYFNADFDSGNLEKIEQLNSYVYKLYPGYDKLLQSTEKTYFNFKVYGFQMCTVRFQIARVHILGKLLKKNQTHLYNPVFRRGKGPYQRVRNCVKIYYNKADEVELSFDFQFEKQKEWVQFSFSYPYSYEDQEQLIKQLTKTYSSHSEIYFHDEVLIKSQEKRNMHLLTITEKSNCLKETQQPVLGLFPEGKERAFKIRRPKIIISGRVHPGETPASFCIEGLLRFLLDQKDYRAYLLRKNFHFIIIPMLNPDGVYNGMFRNDMNGDNLNRVYLNCIPRKHPTIWGFREYLKNISNTSEDPVMFYFDFHAHPSKKQFFIYGNAFNEFTLQVEAETFGKLLEHNCPYFHNIDSIFSKKQMTAKDKNDYLSKEGCGRVFVHRQFDIVHSYTVQCGYFAPGSLHRLEPVDKQSILHSEYTYVDCWEKCNDRYYTPESYMLMGKSILVTILDLFHLNPYTRTNASQYRSIANIRKVMGGKINNAVERFRMTDANLVKKMKQLTKLISENYYEPRVKNYGLSISQNYGFNHPKRTFSLHSRVYQQKGPEKKTNDKTKEKHHRSKSRSKSKEKFKTQNNVTLKQRNNSVSSYESSSISNNGKIVIREKMRINTKDNEFDSKLTENSQLDWKKMNEEKRKKMIRLTKQKQRNEMITDLYQLCQEEQTIDEKNFHSQKEAQKDKSMTFERRKQMKDHKKSGKEARMTSLEETRKKMQMQINSCKNIEQKKFQKRDKLSSPAEINAKLNRIDTFLKKQATKTQKDSMGNIEKFVTSRMRDHYDRPPSKQKQIEGIDIKTRFPVINNPLQSSSNLKKTK